jgi:hypothetical protein
MSRVSYFQRFSQRQNHATNNTLLLLRYFYEESPRKLQKALNEWIDVPVELGLTFQQQVRRESSVPDGLIQQSPLAIYFESKHGNDLWRDQIDRHIAGIGAGEGNASIVLLVGLTREPSSDMDEAAMREAAKRKGVVYRGLTFTRIVEDLRATCALHDEDLLRIVNDYQDFLDQEGLLDERGKRMAVIPCGTSVNENIEFNLYYEPSSRSCRRGVGLIGVYHNKVVVAVGRLVSIGVFKFSSGLISSVEPEVGTINNEQRDRLTLCIAKTDYYDLGVEDMRVYFVDGFVGTNFRKMSPGGVLGIRYLNLDDIMIEERFRPTMTTNEIAEALRGKTFQ